MCGGDRQGLRSHHTTFFKICSNNFNIHPGGDDPTQSSCRSGRQPDRSGTDSMPKSSAGTRFPHVTKPKSRVPRPWQNTGRLIGATCGTPFGQGYDGVPRVSLGPHPAIRKLSTQIGKSLPGISESPALKGHEAIGDFMVDGSALRAAQTGMMRTCQIPSRVRRVPGRLPITIGTRHRPPIDSGPHSEQKVSVGTDVQLIR